MCQKNDVYTGHWDCGAEEAPQKAQAFTSREGMIHHMNRVTTGTVRRKNVILDDEVVDKQERLKQLEAKQRAQAKMSTRAARAPIQGGGEEKLLEGSVNSRTRK